MILIGLGSSLPLCGSPPEEIFRLAIRAIENFAPVSAVSRFYASPAWPDPSDPSFVNAAISVSTDLSAEDLMAALHEVEAAFGRRRGRKNAPRTLDLDLLSYRALVGKGPSGRGPVLPHPRIAERDFVLAPLSDIAPDWVCPSTGKTPREMLSALKTVAVRQIAPR